METLALGYFDGFVKKKKISVSRAKGNQHSNGILLGQSQLGRGLGSTGPRLLCVEAETPDLLPYRLSLRRLLQLTPMLRSLLQGQQRATVESLPRLAAGRCNAIGTLASRQLGGAQWDEIKSVKGCHGGGRLRVRTCCREPRGAHPFRTIMIISQQLAVFATVS